MNIPGQRLSSFVNIWENLRASPEVVKILKHGHEIEFKSRPLLSLLLKSQETILPAQAVKTTRLLVDLLHKGALRVVPNKEALQGKGFYSKLFVVKKPEPGKFRVIINMKPINRYISMKTFKMEGIQDC